MSNPQLSTSKRLGFGFGDFGFSIYYTGLNLFLLYYYTDILNIRPAIAGLMFAIPVIWDAITDPLMGVIASRTRSKYGSYRPYLLYGSLPLAISFIGMFAAPLLLPNAVLAGSIIAHLIFRTCYTIVSIPYTALSAKMTQDSGERGALAGIRMMFAAAGGIFTVFMTLPLAKHLGAGDMKLGFFWLSLIYGAIATIILWCTFASTSEPKGLSRPTSISLNQIWRLLVLNKALVVLICAVIVAVSGTNIFSKALVYYVKYVAGLDLQITTALLVLTVAVTLAMPFWMFVSRYLSKRNVWIIGGCITLSSQIILFLLPPTTIANFLSIVALLGIGNAAITLTFWSMLPDTVEYGEFRSGLRDEGLAFGLNQLALKAATGIGIGILGLLLEFIGYVANQPQSPATIEGLRTVSILIPAICGFLSILIILMYPVDKKLHKRLIAAIRWRNNRST